MVPILDPCNLLSTILIVISSRPDRRDLTGYLDGTIQKKDLKSIDQSAPLQMPTNFKRSAGDQE